MVKGGYEFVLKRPASGTVGNDRKRENHSHPLDDQEPEKTLKNKINKLNEAVTA
jgi:hypothetical protein